MSNSKFLKRVYVKISALNMAIKITPQACYCADEQPVAQYETLQVEINNRSQCKGEAVRSLV